MRLSTILRLPLILGVLVLAACDAGGPERLAGTWTATLVSPNGAEGAAVVELEGAGITAIRPLDGRVFSSIGDDGARVVVVRETPGIVRFEVDLAGAPGVPEARVVEVAGPDDALRPLEGYTVEVAR